MLNRYKGVPARAREGMEPFFTIQERFHDLMRIHGGYRERSKERNSDHETEHNFVEDQAVDPPKPADRGSVALPADGAGGGLDAGLGRGHSGPVGVDLEIPR